MTPRHSGGQLGIAAFAERAGVKTPTLELYIKRPIVSNPVPPPCGRVVGGQRWWCTKHADDWIKRRPHPSRRPPTKPPEGETP